MRRTGPKTWQWCVPGTHRAHKVAIEQRLGRGLSTERSLGTLFPSSPHGAAPRCLGVTRAGPCAHRRRPAGAPGTPRSRGCPGAVSSSAYKRFDLVSECSRGSDVSRGSFPREPSRSCDRASPVATSVVPARHPGWQTLPVRAPAPTLGLLTCRDGSGPRGWSRVSTLSGPLSLQGGDRRHQLAHHSHVEGARGHARRGDSH